MASIGRLVLIGVCLASCAELVAKEPYPEESRDKRLIETLLRVKSFDLSKSEKAQQAVLRYAEHHPGDSRFFEIAERFPLPEFAPLMRDIAIANPSNSSGANAARWLVAHKHQSLIKQTLQEETETATALVDALGLAGDPKCLPLLLPLLNQSNQDVAPALQNAAARAAGRYPQGEAHLVRLAKNGKLPEATRFTVANILHASRDEKVVAFAKEALPLPALKGAQKLPPLAELVKQSGDAEAGKKVFFSKGTCANCHQVQGEGKRVGPDLSEIGDKLSREAMFVAILDPSGGISHNYESYTAIMLSGTVFTGIKVSETAEHITLKSAEAIERTISKDDVDEVYAEKKSLMPADLQKLVTQQELVDVVDYMQTLKKAESQVRDVNQTQPSPTAKSSPSR